jgi:hypothetical protein
MARGDTGRMVLLTMWFAVCFQSWVRHGISAPACSVNQLH